MPAGDPVDRTTTSRRPEPERSGRSVVLYSTLTGVAAAIASPALLLALGALAWQAAGARPLPVGLVLLGVVTGSVSLATFPRRVHLGPGGITRTCWGRRHHLPWSAVAAVTRAPRSRFAAARDLRQQARSPGSAQATVTAGLLARGHGRRSWMLTDQVESQAEYDALCAVLDDVPWTWLRAERPHEGSTPTDLYRRRS